MSPIAVNGTSSPAEVLTVYYVPIMFLSLSVQVVNEWNVMLSAPRASISALLEKNSPASTPEVISLSDKQELLTVEIMLKIKTVNLSSIFEI